MAKLDETKGLELRESVKYNMQLGQFLIAYEEVLEKQLMGTRDEGNFKGLYRNARLLWMKAHDMNIHQNSSVEEVIYFNLQRLRSSKKKKDITDYSAKKKEKNKKKALDRHLVSFIQRKYVEASVEYQKNPDLPKPTMKMAYSAYKKQLKKLNWPQMTENAIKEKYKRLISKNET